MKENGKEYGFTITLKEIPETIPTLWEHTLKFAHEKQLNTTLLRFFGSPEGGYNLCHYWSNFEIASLNLWRDSRYQDYFDYLDSTGNFFYERWGDAIVHSLAAGLYLNKTQVHFFEDIGYKHDNFAHCVNDGIFGKCMCPEDVGNFDEMFGSCLSVSFFFFFLIGEEKITLVYRRIGRALEQKDYSGILERMEIK